MPSDVRFADLQRVLERAGWTLARINGSHHIFTKPKHDTISIPVHRNKVKHVYVAKIGKIIEQGDAEKDSE